MNLDGQQLRKNFIRWVGAIIGLILLAIIVLMVSRSMAGPATARPALVVPPNGVECVKNKDIEGFNSADQLSEQGFFSELYNNAASLEFNEKGEDHFLSLGVTSTSILSGEYVASRITEIDTSYPVDQRVKCWQPTTDRDVVVEMTMRFAQSAAPFGMTENMFLWNAPFSPTGAIPLTAIGVTRSINITTYQPQYSAIVSQDLTFSPKFSGLLETRPMPTWLDASIWHDVRITVSQNTALIEVSQGDHPYTTVMEIALLHAPEPLGFEFSVDNEMIPGTYIPVLSPDQLDVKKFSTGFSH